MPDQGESAIVVLVPEAAVLVHSVRRRYNLADPQVPAHVTVLYPFKPPSEITPEDIEELRRLFARFPPLRFALARLGTFPGTLFLVPSPDESFVALTRAVHEHFPEVPPYGGAYDEIVPHLTLAHVSDERPFECVVEEVEETLREMLPVWVTATEVTLFQRSDEVWDKRTTFALEAPEVDDRSENEPMPELSE
jgi:2'-5' RNA ligase